MAEVPSVGAGGGASGTDQLSGASALSNRERWLTGQADVFRAAVNGAPLEECLDILIANAIDQVEGTSQCAFYLANEDGTELRQVAGVSEDLARHLDGFVRRQATETGEPVITPDLRQKLCQEPWVLLAEKAGYSGAWSFPVETAGGRFVGTFAMYFDQPQSPTAQDMIFARSLCSTASIIIAQSQSQEVLRESEERYRVLFETIDEGFCIVEVLFNDEREPVDYRFLQVNPAFEAHTGLKGAEGRLMRELQPDHEQVWFDTYGKVALTGESARFENEAAALGRWCDVYAFRIGDPKQCRVAILFNDITVRKRADERQRTLLAELQHRVRNTLAVIRSIVRRTAASSTSVEEFELHLDGRLGSFARTQSYVTRDPEKGVDLELIIRDELLAHAAFENRNIKLKGPEVRLNHKQAETIGLAVHELTTNALKHGALHSEGNRIEANWSIEGRGDKRKLRFSWRERLANRRIEAPTRTGFGTELLDRVMAYELDAEPLIEFKEDGLSYQVDIPLPPATGSTH